MHVCMYIMFFSKLQTPMLKRRSICFFRHLNHFSIYKTDDGQSYLVYMHFENAVTNKNQRLEYDFIRIFLITCFGSLNYV